MQLQLRSTEEQDSSIMQAKRIGIRSAGSKKRYLFQSLETGMQIELKGEFTGIREMRKHIAWYTSGMRHSAGLRRDSNLVSSYEELEKLLDVTVQR